jgi:carbon monoxide dehydrogenase subunit G
MKLDRELEIGRPRDEVVEVLCREETLLGLFPGKTEVVSRGADSLETRTHYTALGREGEAKFVWTFRMDGSVAFEKVCDGRVWKQLSGLVEVDENGDDASVVVIEMQGATKGLVPEFTIKGPMEEQIGEMAQALSRILERATPA